jgi:WD40 repeat protein
VKAREASSGDFHQGSFHLSPDGRRILSPTWAIHDLTTGELMLNAQLPPWSWGAFSSDAKRFMTIESGGFVAFWETTRLWELRVPQLLARIHAHEDHGRAVAYAPAGDLAASGAEDIILWDARTRTKLARFEHPAYVSSLAFSPDGRSLVSMHGDGAILLWDVIERKRVANFNEHSAPVRTVSFSADAKRLASAGEDRSVIIWDLERRRKQAVLLGHQRQVTGVAFAPDGSSAASCDQDGNLIFWDLERRQPRWVQPAVNKVGDEASYGVAISPDARWVATSYGVYQSADGHLVVDFRTEDRRFRELRGIAFSAAGRWLAGASARGVIFLWVGAGRQLVASQKLSNANFVSLSFSPDGRRLVTGEDQGGIRLWETEPLREIATLGRHPARVKSVAFGPDGREVASASDDQTIALWDVASRRLLRRIGTHTAPVLSIAFSPDGRRLAAGLHDRSVRLYTRHYMLLGRRLD